MEYYEKENSVVLKNVKNFNIEEILECGQCFRFEKIDDLKYKDSCLWQGIVYYSDRGQCRIYSL
ncbi:MAG: DNA glycosylase [Lachnospirales bacterium]